MVGLPTEVAENVCPAAFSNISLILGTSLSKDCKSALVVDTA
jgi:hypothetical protein